jgi:hypothetical protein
MIAITTNCSTTENPRRKAGLRGMTTSPTTEVCRAGRDSRRPDHRPGAGLGNGRNRWIHRGDGLPSQADPCRPADPAQVTGGWQEPYSFLMDQLTQLAWILGGGLAMSLIAMIGGLTTVLPKPWLDRLLLPLVALAAGTLFGGAVFHMLPEASESLGPRAAAGWLAAGFTTFLALEQFL